MPIETFSQEGVTSYVVVIPTLGVATHTSPSGDENRPCRSILIPRTASVGQVLGRRHLGRPEAGEELAGDGVALAELLGCLLPHVAAAEDRRPVAQLVQVVRQFDRALE